MTEEEKKKILDQHRNMEKESREKREELKKGIKTPEKKETPK